MILRGEKRAQLTVFIIAAIVIVAISALFFLLRGQVFTEQIPPSIQPAYNRLLTCLEQETETGLGILGSQAGYIDIPEFEPGSSYMPFSNQLDFLGNPIPYWYYVSGNNIEKDQVPTKSFMEDQLAEFISQEIQGCEFNEFYEQGFEISIESPEVETEIRDSEVETTLDMVMSINKGEDNAVIDTHRIIVNSNIGSMYDSARKIYDHEQETLFLEEYGIDFLRLYAPVDGVELTCSPLTWNADEVFEEVRDAIQSNTQALKIGNNDYSIKNETGRYFIREIEADHEVRILNSKNWPYSLEVSPADTSALIAKPVGTQPGLGILGFCYVPYHFVYDVKYPVLIQVFEGDELFQFPMAVIIEGNNPREALETTASEINAPEICEQSNTPVNVNIYSTSLSPIDANISYECATTSCEIGETEGGTIEGMFPQCVNGFVIARADGYMTKKEEFSVMSQGSVDIILDKLYEKNVQLKMDGKDYNGQATVTFITEDGSKTIAYPEQKSIELTEDQYTIQVYAYRNSSIRIGASTAQHCVDVPESGVGGFLGLTREKCVNIDFPSQIISNALSAGGNQEHYILESKLSNSETLEINMNSLPAPSSIEQLQENYILVEDRGLEINLI